MITRIVTNRVKPGKRKEYIAVSRDFCAALVKECGCLEAKVYEDLDSDNVINIECWPDRESAVAVTGTKTFKEYLPRLMPCFDGNESLFLQEI